MQTIKQDWIERDAKLYEKLDRQVQSQISTLRTQKANAKVKKNDPKASEATRNIWAGMYTAYNNALTDLELAYSRANNDL